MTIPEHRVSQPGHREAAALARALFPDLASQVDAAAPFSAADLTGPEDSIDAWISNEVSRMNAGELGDTLAARSSDAERTRIDASITAARAAADSLGVQVPTFEELSAAGVRAARIEGLDASSGADSLPALLPVLAPHGLGLSAWQRLFGEAHENVTNSVTGGEASTHQTRLRGLVVAEEIERWFSALDRVQDPTLPRLNVTEPRGEVAWTLRWIPASPTALIVGRPYRVGPHPSLSELLMLQWIRQHFGDAPIDAQSLTWVAGDLPEPRLAARHTYDVAAGLIRINTRERTDQGPHIGTRPPVG
jgi:hypothetical protein